MTRRPPRSTRTDTLFPYTTLFLSPINLPSCIYGPAYADELAAQADRGIRTVSIPLDTVQYDEPWMFTNILSARFGDITVKYIAGYSGGQAHQFTSQLSLPLHVIVGPNESRVRRTTHDLDVFGSAYDDRLEWVGGDRK